MDTAQVSINRWKDKEDVVCGMCIPWNIIQHKKNEHTTWMNHKIIMQSETS